MAAGRYDITIEQGVDFERTLTYLVGEDAVPFDFTGYTGLLQVRNRPGGTVYLTMSTANGKLQLGGVLGTVLLLLDETETSALSWTGRAYYDILIDNGSDSFRLLEGRVALSPPVSIP